MSVRLARENMVLGQLGREALGHAFDRVVEKFLRRPCLVLCELCE